MKRWLCASLALIFYASVLPWSSAEPLKFSLGSGSTVRGTDGTDYGISDLFDSSSSYSRTIRPGDVITKGPWVDVRAYGASTSATGATNLTAFQAAFDNASTGSIKPVVIPAGNYNLTGTVDTKGCPIIGAGSTKTVIFPTTSVPAFRVTAFAHGKISGVGVDFTNVTAAGITSSAVGFDLWSANQCIFEDCMVTRGYYGWRVLSTNGDGYIWQVTFRNCISNYNKYQGWYIDSASNSTTLKWDGCHVYGIAALDNAWSGGWTTYRGWYLNNSTSNVFSNCSMDGGDGTANGSVIYVNNYFSVEIDTFHLETFTHSTGGTSSSPINFEAGYVNIGNLFLISYEIAVGGGNTGYAIRSAAYGTVIGNVVESSTTSTSGTLKYMYSSGYPFTVTSPYMQRAKFVRPDDVNMSRQKMMEDMFFWPAVKNINSTADISVDNASATDILTLTPLDPTTTNKNYGMFLVAGMNQSTGNGWTDLILVTSPRNGTTTVSAVGSDNSGSPPTRTYSYNTGTDSIALTTNSATAHVVTVYGTEFVRRWW